ncbi:MAG: VOC family protein [Solirubrobacteraceae bacterium]
MPVEHSYDPARGFPRVMPSLRYEDVGAALQWLGDVFGLIEHLRWTGADGVVRHAEMRIEGAHVELSGASEEYPSPKALGGVSHSIVVLVDDVDAHYEHARERGATIVSEPEDKPWGLRQYTAQDLEGHRWELSQFVRHAPPEEWGAELTGSGGSSASTG